MVLNGTGCTTLTADVAKADVEPGRSPNAGTTISIALSLKFAMIPACSFSFLARLLLSPGFIRRSAKRRA
jgi:hypothetical protein